MFIQSTSSSASVNKITINPDLIVRFRVDLISSDYFVVADDVNATSHQLAGPFSTSSLAQDALEHVLDLVGWVKASEV